MEKPFTIKPKFWGDTLWNYPVLILILSIWFGVLMYRFSGGGDEWMGTTVIIDILVLPIFFLLWFDQLCNCVIFEDNQLILKGFLHRQKVAYQDIKDISFSDQAQPILIYFDPKLNKNNYQRLPIWNHSINILIDEIKKHTDVRVEGYPNKINRANFYGKIWMLVIITATAILFTVFFKP